ncbi:MAG TPA: hypothetical protein VEH84_15025, partial [Alphaproteobacteria bacterium]|nr:hypothetical protein [Alphaproteobacteria bacterium]
IAAPAPAQIPSDGYAASAEMVPGHYACLEFRGNRPVEFGSYTGTRFSNEFDIVDGATYAYRGTKRIEGGYSLDKATGVIAWKTGPFSPDPDGSAITGHNTTRKSDGKPAIILTFHIPKFPDTNEFCALVTK